VQASSGKWEARIRLLGKWESGKWEDGKLCFLGSFVLEQNAAKEYDTAALQRDGHKAKLNFPSQEGQLQHQPGMGTKRAYASQHRGVTWDKQSRKWAARTYRDGKTYRLGRFETEEDAAKAVSEWMGT
jgi:hypothetical protein